MLIWLFSLLSFFVVASEPIKIALILSPQQEQQLELGKPQAGALTEAITHAGGQVLYISSQHEHKGEYSALVIPGGDDIDPSLYGEPRSPKTEIVDTPFDQFELATIKEAEKKHMPVLGICKGLQLLNVAAGGTLYQDLPTELGGETHVTHRQKNGDEFVAIEHKIKIEEASHLKEYLGQSTVSVNSYHHQGIKRLGHGLKAVAHSDDNLVEAIEGTGPDYVLGVQFHPEKNEHHRADYEKIFTSFVNKAKSQPAETESANKK